MNQLKKKGVGEVMVGSQPSSQHGEHQVGREEHVPAPGMEEKEQLEMCTT